MRCTAEHVGRRGARTMNSQSDRGMRYSNYFGALAGAENEADRAAIFFERLAKFFADLGTDIRSSDGWRSLAARLGFEYHPADRLKGPRDPVSPDWEGLDGLRLIADLWALGIENQIDRKVCDTLTGDAPYKDRYQGDRNLYDRLGAARVHFGWLVEILDQAEAQDFPARRAFVETFSAAGPGKSGQPE